MSRKEKFLGFRGVAAGTVALGAAAAGGFAIGALAVGAIAIGALAIGRLAIGRLLVGHAEFQSLAVRDLTVAHLRPGEVTVTGSLQLPERSEQRLSS